MSNIGQLPTRPRCWQCTQPVDGYGWAPGQDFRAPADGDYSVCLHCSAYGVYADTPYGVMIRRPTEAEGLEMDTDLGVRQALGGARAYQRGD